MEERSASSFSEDDLKPFCKWSQYPQSESINFSGFNQLKVTSDFIQCIIIIEKKFNIEYLLSYSTLLSLII